MADDDQALWAAATAQRRAQAEQEVELTSAIEARDAARVAELGGVSLAEAVAIIASAAHSREVSNAVLLARMPPARLPWYRRLLQGPARWPAGIMAATTAALLVLLRLPLAAPMTTPLLASHYVGAGEQPSSNPRMARMARIEVQSACALESTVHVTRWPGTGPSPSPPPEPTTRALVWDDDQRLRAYLDVKVEDDRKGETFVLALSCRPTARQLIGALSTPQRPWVSVQTHVLPPDRVEGPR